MFLEYHLKKKNENTNNSSNSVGPIEEDDCRLSYTFEVETGIIDNISNIIFCHLKFTGETDICHEENFISLKKLKKADRQPGLCKIEAYISSYTNMENLQFLQFFCPACHKE